MKEQGISNIQFGFWTTISNTIFWITRNNCWQSHVYIYFLVFLNRLLKMAFSNLSLENFKMFYATYVRPHLDYCLQAVCPYMVQDIQRLEKVQRRATKLVRELKSLPYQGRLLKLDLLSISDRLLWGHLIEVYKIVMGRVDIDPRQFFELQEGSSTRGHHLKLKKRRAANHCRNQVFANLVITPWNELPEHVVSAPSVNSFKRRLAHYWATNVSPIFLPCILQYPS